MPLIHARFYASLREHFREPSMRLDVADGTTVEAFARALVPGSLFSGLRFAVNDAFVAPEHVLEAGDTVDLLPPFGGG